MKESLNIHGAFGTLTIEGPPINYGQQHYFVKTRNKPVLSSQTGEVYKRGVPLLSQSVEHTVSKIKSKYKLNTSLITA